MNQPTVLEYAHPIEARNPYSVRTANYVRWMALGPLLVAGAILATFAASRWEWLTTGGFIWLYVGGALEFAAGTMCLVFAVLTREKRPEDLPARRIYLQALLLSVLSLPIALGCVIVGVWLSGRA